MYLRCDSVTAADSPVASAALNTSKTLETFDFTFNPGLNRQVVYDSATSNFMRATRNMLVCGPTALTFRKPKNREGVAPED